MLNPNTSAGVTDLIMAAALPVAAPGTELIPATAPRGVPYIATRAEAVLGGAIALEMLAEMHTDVDAAVISAFADPGLGGARELFPIPVIGLAEAGMLTACMLGGRFAIVTFASALEPWYRECVALVPCRKKRRICLSPSPAARWRKIRPMLCCWPVRRSLGSGPRLQVVSPCQWWIASLQR